MSKYICTNCDHEEEIEVVEKIITDDDGNQYKIKVSEKGKCSRCGWTHWKDAE